MNCKHNCILIISNVYVQHYKYTGSDGASYLSKTISELVLFYFLNHFLKGLYPFLFSISELLLLYFKPAKCTEELSTNELDLKKIVV